MKYQEQPQLLDPHLESLVEPLTAALQAVAQSGVLTADMTVKAKRTGFLLHVLCSVRGSVPPSP